MSLEDGGDSESSQSQERRSHEPTDLGDVKFSKIRPGVFKYQTMGVSSSSWGYPKIVGIQIFHVPFFKDLLGLQIPMEFKSSNVGKIKFLPIVGIQIFHVPLFKYLLGGLQIPNYGGFQLVMGVSKNGWFLSGKLLKWGLTQLVMGVPL